MTRFAILLSSLKTSLLLICHCSLNLTKITIAFNAATEFLLEFCISCSKFIFSFSKVSIFFIGFIKQSLDLLLKSILLFRSKILKIIDCFKSSLFIAFGGNLSDLLDLIVADSIIELMSTFIIFVKERGNLLTHLLSYTTKVLTSSFTSLKTSLDKFFDTLKLRFIHLTNGFILLSKLVFTHLLIFSKLKPFCSCHFSSSTGSYTLLLHMVSCCSHSFERCSNNSLTNGKRSFQNIKECFSNGLEDLLLQEVVNRNTNGLLKHVV